MDVETTEMIDGDKNIRNSVKKDKLRILRNISFANAGFLLNFIAFSVSTAVADPELC